MFLDDLNKCFADMPVCIYLTSLWRHRLEALPVTMADRRIADNSHDAYDRGRRGSRI